MGIRMDKNYDYIIIGAGSAGCVLANMLSSDPKNKVLLLESGGKDDSFLFNAPLGVAVLLQTGRGDWGFNSEPMKDAHNKSIKYPRGKVLGGSSSINGMIYIRGHSTDYDEWAALGNKGWSFNEVLPYFKKSEDNERGESEFHGAGGPLKVSTPSPINNFSLAIIESAKRRGHLKTDDFNGKEQDGFGVYQRTISNGRRWSAAKGYLRPVQHRSNLTVLIDTHVTRILIEDKRAIGVEISINGELTKALAAKEVLLSAGSIQSPQVLMLSGLGPKEHLAEFKIKPILDLPGVGKNLFDHSLNLIIYSAKGSSAPVKNWKAIYKGPLAILNYIFRGKGPIATGGGDAGGFIRTLPELSKPDIQYHLAGLVYPTGLDKPGSGLPDDGYTALITVLHPHSVGEIRLKSANPLDAPAIDLRFFEDPRDMETAVRGFKIIREILNGDPLNKHFIKEILPGEAVQTDEEIREYLREYPGTTFHPVGTCKMGHDKMAVVDDRLKVRGIKGLRVVDASIMPTLVGGNTNAPTIMIAEKAADMILEDNR